MTINKLQEQTMIICGLDLEHSYFSHGKLFVVCSHVGKPSNIFIYAPDRLIRKTVNDLALR